MTNSILIKNARIVNEGRTFAGDVRIKDQRIDLISSEISASESDEIIDAAGKTLLPGMIDDQVHFREPGLTHKGSIASESRAAVAGGITSFMEMPNVNPSTTTIEALENKYAIATENSMANFGFYLGATGENIDEIQSLDPKKYPGVKVFMGASTGDLLVEAPEALEDIFSKSPVLVLTHCESGPVIARNLESVRAMGRQITILDHPVIRDAEACFASSSYAVDLAKRHGTQLHVLHITTEKELSLFEPGPMENKSITAEACVHHLWFSDQDYPQRGNLIKCNPAIKSAQDREALIKALATGQIDIVATDHAPHTLPEKDQPYEKAPAGLPLVEHALLTLLDHVKAGRMTIEQVVEKMAHNPAKRFAVADRGFIREGYFADLVLVDRDRITLASHETARYRCGWTPFDGHQFSSHISATWVNGHQVFDGSAVDTQKISAQRLVFDR